MILFTYNMAGIKGVTEYIRGWVFVLIVAYIEVSFRHLMLQIGMWRVCESG